MLAGRLCAQPSHRGKILEFLSALCWAVGLAPSPEATGLMHQAVLPRAWAPGVGPYRWSWPSPALKSESLCIPNGLSVKITEPQRFRTSVPAFPWQMETLRPRCRSGMSYISTVQCSSAGEENLDVVLFSIQQKPSLFPVSHNFYHLLIIVPVFHPHGPLFTALCHHVQIPRGGEWSGNASLLLHFL